MACPFGFHRSLARAAILLGLFILLQAANWQTQVHVASAQESGTGAFVEFADVTRQAGLSLTKTPTHGIAWGDFDNDGWVDLYVGHHAGRPLLMRNQHDGTFADVTDAAGMGVLTDRHACVWADFNNDAKLDLYCASGADHGTGSKPNQLWRNNGDGTFQDVATNLGVVDGPGRGRSVNWLDYNQDGRLDIFVGNQLGPNPATTSRLYRNDGTSFVDVAAQSGFGKQLVGVTSAVGDYDQDNLWDLAVATNDKIFLFKNKGNGSFRELNPQVTGLYAKNVRALAWGDFDNDGYPDLYAAASYGGSKLFRNEHNGHFTDVTGAANLQQVSRFPAEDALWADLNNDGFLDLFVVRQGTNRFTNSPDLVLRNNGNGTFTDVTSIAQLAGPADGQGDSAATADYDNDGFLDLFVTNGAGPAGTGRLYHNLANRNHWLTIQLRGTNANASAIGSKIWLSSDGKKQYREYLDGSTGRAQNAIGAHFGLGKSANIQSIRIRWADNQIQEITNVPADRILVILQPNLGVR